MFLVDYGPICKLIPGVLHETDPDTLILIVDDDQIYSERLVQELSTHAKNFPNAAISFAGGTLGTFPSYVGFAHFTMKTPVSTLRLSYDVPTRTNTLAGFCGSCLRRKFFPSNQEFMQEVIMYTKDIDVRKNDDLIISHMLSRRNVPIYLFMTSMRHRNLEYSEGLSRHPFSFFWRLVRAWFKLHDVAPWPVIHVPFFQSLSTIKLILLLSVYFCVKNIQHINQNYD